MNYKKFILGLIVFLMGIALMFFGPLLYHTFMDGYHLKGDDGFGPFMALAISCMVLLLTGGAICAHSIE